MTLSSFVFYSDAPPLLEGGHGNNGIAVQILKIFKDRLSVVLTRKARRTISRNSISQACAEVGLVLHPDASGYGLKKFFPVTTSILDFLLFAVWILFKKNARLKQNDWFILCGSDCWFLLHIRLLQILGVATHIYLVDEIETAATYTQPKWVQERIRPILSAVLKDSSSVYAISEGFVNFLQERFQCKAHWLPLPSTSPPGSRAIVKSKKQATRNIVFIGGLNHLYLSSLVDLYSEISLYNLKFPAHLPWKLEILSYSPESVLRKALPDFSHVIFQQNIPTDQRIERLCQSTACFLPYSFSLDERLMVSTSFSCKILEYFSSGSLLLVYGPSYASIPQYFSKENLPICTSSRAELRRALHQMDVFQNLDYSAKYYSAWQKYHSPEAFRNIVFKVSQN